MAAITPTTILVTPSDPLTSAARAMSTGNTAQPTTTSGAGGDSVVAPAMCYENCNNAYIEVQSVGKVASVCDANSDFLRSYQECVSCVEANADDVKSILDSYIEPKFQQFLEFCASQTLPPIYHPTSMTTRTVVQLIDITALNGNVQEGVPQTRTVTELKPEATSLVSVISEPLSPHASSLQTWIPNETTPASPSPESTSKAWIAGPVIGVLTAILLLLAGLWFLRRRRRQGVNRLPAGGDDNGKEEYTKAQLHSDCVPRQPLMGLEGSYPKATPELSANEVPAQEMPVSDGQHVEGVTWRVS